MDEKTLMRKEKAELLQILASRGIKADPKALKKVLLEIVRLSESSPRPAPTENETVRAAQQKVEETKFATEAPATETAPSEPAGETPPEGPAEHPAEPIRKYGEDRITAMVRDPYWIFAYWEVTAEGIERARGELGAEGAGAEIALRVYSVAGKLFDGNNAHDWFDIRLVEDAESWYIETGRPGASYCVDIGLLGPGGEFQTIARSRTVSTPRASMSDEIDARWMTLGEEFELIYALSGGFEVGKSSAELLEMMRRQLEMHLASEALASLSVSAR